MGFTKLDEGILRSSIMAEDPATFKVWIALLAACGPDGIARVSPVFISAVCRLSPAAINRAIARLEAPDPDSRSKNNEGRRVLRIDGGWRIINYQKYRFFNYEVSPKESRRRASWQYDNGSAEGYVYFVRAGDRIKVGFSRNPWGRLSELRSGNLDVELIGTFPGNLEDEARLHEKFRRFRIAREWFRAEPEFIEEVLTAIKAHDGRIRESTTNAPTLVATEPATEGSLNREGELRRSSVASASASASASSTSSQDKDIEEIKRRWNEFAVKHNLATITRIDPKRERGRHLRARMAEKDWDFPRLIEIVEESPFLLGKKGKEPFFVTLDWLLWPGNYLRVMEGNYRERRQSLKDWAKEEDK